MTEKSKYMKCEKHDECSAYKIVERKTFKVSTSFSTYNQCYLTVGKYNNNHVAIQIMCEEGPLATMTVNHEKLACFDDNWSCVDVNNAPFVEDLIKDLGIGHFTGYRLLSGWVKYPVYNFDMQKINEYVNN